MCGDLRRALFRVQPEIPPLIHFETNFSRGSHRGSKSRLERHPEVFMFLQPLEAEWPMLLLVVVFDSTKGITHFVRAD
jgi:hypothetical protein